MLVCMVRNMELKHTSFLTNVEEMRGLEANWDGGAPTQAMGLNWAPW